MASWNDKSVTNDHLLPYVDSACAAPDVKAALQTLPFERNIFKLVANAKCFFPAFMKLLSCAWSDKRTIRSTDWQLIVLRTAALLDAPYEWAVNEPVAGIFGFDHEKLLCIREGDLSSPNVFTDRQRLLGNMVEQLVLQNKVSQDTMLRAKEVFGDEGVMEILLTQGIYALLAKIMQSAQIDHDPEIPGLEDQLRKYNAATIEKEKFLED
ncbi:hypothetical protein JMJ35_002440 [Cladonia borealis]|uniref:Uncharacterized protein n=1 Tax=Cladonia borealis TaxID=184061 RepID=A0AA39R7U6_9LECA|nr:hypothetical protein JMJ35_002440 [Cladonia borealis]